MWVIKLLASIKYFMSFLNRAIFLQVFLRCQDRPRDKDGERLFFQILNSSIYISSTATESDIIKALSGYTHMELFFQSSSGKELSSGLKVLLPSENSQKK